VTENDEFGRSGTRAEATLFFKMVNVRQLAAVEHGEDFKIKLVETMFVSLRKMAKASLECCCASVDLSDRNLNLLS